MSDPLSWLALEAIKARLQTIRIANGYLTDCGENVSLDAVGLDAVKAPRIAAVAGDFTDLPSSANIKNTSMALTIEMTVPITYAKAQRIAHGARWDIRRCLTETSEYLPINARKLSLGNSRILTRPGGAAIVVTQFDAVLGITEHLK